MKHYFGLQKFSQNFTTTLSGMHKGNKAKNNKIVSAAVKGQI